MPIGRIAAATRASTIRTMAATGIRYGRRSPNPNRIIATPGRTTAARTYARLTVGTSRSPSTAHASPSSGPPIRIARSHGLPSSRRSGSGRKREGIAELNGGTNDFPVTQAAAPAFPDRWCAWTCRRLLVTKQYVEYLKLLRSRNER